MKVCLVCEGSYPYEKGGVSSWLQMLISSMPDIEFQLLTIIVDEKRAGKFQYDPPKNLTKITETYLIDYDYLRDPKRKTRLDQRQRAAFHSFIMGEDINWPVIFDFFIHGDISVNQLLMGKDFLEIITEFYDAHYPSLPFTDFLWTYRSMMLPMCTLLKNRMPEADLYHSISTGYAGVLSTMCQYQFGKPSIITEHGIYTREREEEVIRSTAFSGPGMDLWINHFYKLSGCAYTYGDLVTSLFEDARLLQVELGCDKRKTIVIPNGVVPERFDGAPEKNDDSVINLGIVARITSIKDIKTLISAFAVAKEAVPNLHLYIMGGAEKSDLPYLEECTSFVENLSIKDVIFTGSVDVFQYIKLMDMIILTSISEGQPISLLEAMSAYRPCIATKVGNCEELLLGSRPDDEPCGIITPVMNVHKISQAIITLAQDKQLRQRYGYVGRQRVEEKYRLSDMISTYRGIYDQQYAKNKTKEGA